MIGKIRVGGADLPEAGSCTCLWDTGLLGYWGTLLQKLPYSFNLTQPSAIPLSMFVAELCLGPQPRCHVYLIHLPSRRLGA